MEEIIAILVSRFGGEFHPELNCYSAGSDTTLYTLRLNAQDLIAHSPMDFEIYPVNELTCIDGNIYHDGVIII